MDKRVQLAVEEVETAKMEAQAATRQAFENAFKRKHTFETQLLDAEHQFSKAEAHITLAEDQLELKTLEIRQLRGNGTARAQKKAKFQLKKGRAYKEDICALARTLISCGCKQGRVGEIIEEVADFTMSSDSTSRRKKNYQSHHIFAKVPVGRDANGNIIMPSKPKAQFAGVLSTVDHTTATSHSVWMSVYNDLMHAYNKSPLGKRTGLLHLRQICQRLQGMCSDHANNEKALLEQWRKTKYNDRMQQWTAKKIEDAGGIDAWRALPPDERAARDLATVSAMIEGLGVEELASMDKADQSLLFAWVWTGCCMHKDQNSFRGGNVAMTAHWKKLGVPGPISLANKDAAKAIRKILHPEEGDRPLTDEDWKRLEDTACRGTKLTALAGAIFNNALDKRGQGDTHQLFLEHHLDLERVKRFPQTNNTRFGSHGEAAIELLTNLEAYRRFMEVIKLRKVAQNFTNIEKNVHDGLYDGPTLTELAVLSLYHILITAPYMRIVHQEDEVTLNVISLGPLHRDIRDHCQLLIEQPNLILDFEKEIYILATFDGKPLANTVVVDQIKALHDTGKLLYLQEMFAAFLNGALATWIRFSSEYSPGGVIDRLTDIEKGCIWLPATNDWNKGALGAYIVWARKNPTAAPHTHNGLAMCRRNGTHEFAQLFFTQEDHNHVLAAAQRLETMGLERQRRKLQKEYNTRILVEKEQALVEKVAKEDAVRKRLEAIPYITSIADIYLPRMTRTKLDDQLEKLHQHLAQKQDALAKAFIAHLRLLDPDNCSTDSSSLFGDTSDCGMIEEEPVVVEDFWEEEDHKMEED
ncbi:hypothetical protein B0H13DRAFT_1885364 [Mycena leptocephala]|nr:hypothetical protein B0H13DRAFT_1885364 [Mycena leptocephala]